MAFIPCIDEQFRKTVFSTAELGDSRKHAGGKTYAPTILPMWTGDTSGYIVQTGPLTSIGNIHQNSSIVHVLIMH